MSNKWMTKGKHKRCPTCGNVLRMNTFFFDGKPFRNLMCYVCELKNEEMVVEGS